MHEHALTGLSTGPEIAVACAAQRSMVTGPGNGFWLQGITVDGSLPVYRMGPHELSLAANLTFEHSSSTGGVGLPLDVLTILRGPPFS